MLASPAMMRASSFAIVVTLAVQTTTKHWLARRLRLLEAIIPPAEPPPYSALPADAASGVAAP